MVLSIFKDLILDLHIICNYFFKSRSSKTFWMSSTDIPLRHLSIVCSLFIAPSYPLPFTSSLRAFPFNVDLATLAQLISIPFDLAMKPHIIHARILLLITNVVPNTFQYISSIPTLFSNFKPRDLILNFLDPLKKTNIPLL